MQARSPFITADWLAEHGACATQVETVAREFPAGERLTHESLARCAEVGLGILWIAETALTEDGLATCKEMMRAANEKYGKARRVAISQLAADREAGIEDAKPRCREALKPHDLELRRVLARSIMDAAQIHGWRI